MAEQELDPLNGDDEQLINMQMESSVKQMSCCDKLRLLTHPITSREVVMKNGDAETHLTIVPEAFRMLFYFGFIVFSLIAFTVSMLFSELDVNDNPILDRFGANNICIFYDYPPFTYFSSSLWVFNVIMLLLYEYFDLYRVYDAMQDGQGISKTFYNIYRMSTIFECASIIFFIQITATSPFENMYFHAGPFVILLYGLWAMAFKKHIYFNKIGLFEDYPGYVHVLGYVYVFLYLACIITKSCTTVPNLFHAELWKQPGLEWTSPVSAFNDRLYLVMVIICPMIIYFTIIGDSDVQAIKLVVNRTRKK